MKSIAVLPATRVVKGGIITLSHQFTDQDGEPAAAAATPTVVVTDAEGTAVTTDAAVDGGSGSWSVATSAAVTEVGWLSAAWTVSGSVVATDLVEVVGGTIGSVAAIKATDTSLNTETPAMVLSKRRTVEDTATRVLGRSPFERFYTQRVDGTGTDRLWLAWPDLLEVLWVRCYTSATAYTELTAAQLASIPADPYGMAVRTDGGWFPAGRSNIEIGYRFGMVELPGDLREALHKSVRHAIVQFDTGVPDFAASMSTGDGFSIGLAGPGNDMWATGDRTVDRVINGYKSNVPAVA